MDRVLNGALIELHTSMLGTFFCIHLGEKHANFQENCSALLIGCVDFCPRVYISSIKLLLEYSSTTKFTGSDKVISKGIVAQSVNRSFSFVSGNRVKKATCPL